MFRNKQGNDIQPENRAKCMQAEYWKSQGRKFCDFCKCWIADNKPSIEFHEGGKKHKENVSKRLKEIHKNSAKQAKQNKKFEEDLKKMEAAAMAAYLKDVESAESRDLTAENIIKAKQERRDKGISEDPDPGNTVVAKTVESPELGPRYKGKSNREKDIDPCDPKAACLPKWSAPNKNNKSGKNTGKTKSKKVTDDSVSTHKAKSWYEAVSPEGYPYYWNTITNETAWEPPEEGFVSIAQQEEDAKEEEVQRKLLEQLEREEAEEKAELLEEQRANTEREKMKALVKKEQEESEENSVSTGSGTTVPYRRDYSVPEKPEPYGTWKTVRTIETKPVDLQLPTAKRQKISFPTFASVEPPPVKIERRTFQEKTVSSIARHDEDSGFESTTFKKPKFGNRNIRKRLSPD